MEDNKGMMEVSEVDADGSEVGAVGLDIGTSRIVMAGGTNGHKAVSQLNAFVGVPYSKMTEAILQQNKMVYHRNGKELFVFGNDSERFASFFNAVPRRPMQHGVLNPQEPMGQQIIDHPGDHRIDRAARAQERVALLQRAGQGRGRRVESGLSRSGFEELSAVDGVRSESGQ
jgi:hypothetical protein